MLFVIFPLLLLTFYLSFYHFDYCVSWCVPPFVYSSWNSLQFLDMVDYFLSCVRKVFSYYLSKYFLRSSLSLSLSGTPTMRMMVHSLLFQRSLRLSPFFIFHSFFYILFCSSDFYHYVFQVTSLFFCINYSVSDSF